MITVETYQKRKTEVLNNYFSKAVTSIDRSLEKSFTSNEDYIDICISDNEYPVSVIERVLVSYRECGWTITDVGSDNYRFMLNHNAL